MGAPAPSGYQSALSTLGAVTDAKTYSADGQLAASGRVALYGTYAIIDQVVTDAAHRRKGLGSVVMHHLCQHAVAQGANTGVLVATEDGLALYRRLGWELHSPVTAAVIAA